MLRRIFAVCLLLILGDLIAVIGFNALADNLPPRGTLASDAGEKAGIQALQGIDAVVVFCAGIGPHSGLDETTVERLGFASEIFRSGGVRTVVGIGGHWRENRATNQRAGMTALLAAAGVPPRAIVQDRDSYDTLTNLDEFRRLAEENSWRRVAFVTSPLHMLRVRYLSASESSPEIISLPFTSTGQANLFAAWREAHHEAIAWGMTLLLPEALFRKIMRWRRL